MMKKKINPRLLNEARIQINGRLRSIGCFRTIEEAKAARTVAAIARDGEYART
jgi:hypothetical protein